LEREILDNRYNGAMSDDTAPEVARLQIAGWRALSPARKLALAFEMGDAVRALVEAGVRLRHPGEPPEQTRYRVAAILYGEDLANRAYGHKEPQP